MGNVPKRTPNPGLPVVTAALIAAAFFLSGCRQHDMPVRNDNRPLPDIILISIDTLRADHLGCYGHANAQTPNIDNLAAEGTLFEHALTTVPITLPAHSSLLTGQIPPVHGVRDNGTDRLADSAETLAEVLSSNGYQTAAFIGAEPLKKDRGLGQGFDLYDDPFNTQKFGKDRFAQRSDRFAEDVAASAAAWIQSCDSSKPIFAFVHFFDPHWPYEKTLPGQQQPGYDGEIAYVDRVIGQFLQSISADRDASNRLLVITSDHGEGLGEHREQHHCIFVYDSTMHIPLIMHGPGLSSSRRIADGVGIIDIAPTLLDAVGLDGLASVDGISLVDAVNQKQLPERELYFESLYGNFRFGWAPLRGIRRGSLKFIEAPKPELYDTAIDPDELNNLFEAGNPNVQEFRESLVDIGDGSRVSEELDDEAIRRLANLGYVSARPADANNDQDFADPKDRIEVYDRFHSAYQMFVRGSHDEALTVMEGLEKVMSGSPQFYFEWGFFQIEAQQWPAAIRSYKRCLELSPVNLDARLNLAAAQMKTGDYGDASNNLEILLTESPDHPLAHLYAGFCAKELENMTAAIDHWRRFVELAPDHIDAARIRQALESQPNR